MPIFSATLIQIVLAAMFAEIAEHVFVLHLNIAKMVNFVIKWVFVNQILAVRVVLNAGKTSFVIRVQENALKASIAKKMKNVFVMSIVKPVKFVISTKILALIHADRITIVL